MPSNKIIHKTIRWDSKRSDNLSIATSLTMTNKRLFQIWTQMYCSSVTLNILYVSNLDSLYPPTSLYQLPSMPISSKTINVLKRHTSASVSITHNFETSFSTIRGKKSNVQSLCLNQLLRFDSNQMFQKLTNILELNKVKYWYSKNNKTKNI